MASTTGGCLQIVIHLRVWGGGLLQRPSGRKGGGAAEGLSTSPYRGKKYLCEYIIKINQNYNALRNGKYAG